MVDAAEHAFLEAFEKVIRANGLKIARRIPLSDGAYVYHIDKPDTEWRFTCEVPRHRWEQDKAHGNMLGAYVVARFLNDIDKAVPTSP